MKHADIVSQESLAQLRKWLKPGDIIYTVLRHRSTSGMTGQRRRICSQTSLALIRSPCAERSEAPARRPKNDACTTNQPDRRRTTL